MLWLTVVQSRAVRKRRAGRAAPDLRAPGKLLVAAPWTTALPACHEPLLRRRAPSSAAGHPQALAWLKAGAAKRVEVDDLLHDDTRVGTGLGLRGDRPQGLAGVYDDGGQVLVDRAGPLTAVGCLRRPGRNGQPGQYHERQASRRQHDRHHDPAPPGQSDRAPAWRQARVRHPGGLAQSLAAPGAADVPWSADIAGLAYIVGSADGAGPTYTARLAGVARPMDGGRRVHVTRPAGVAGSASVAGSARAGHGHRPGVPHGRCAPAGRRVRCRPGRRASPTVLRPG